MKTIPYCPYADCPSNVAEDSPKAYFRKKGFEYNKRFGKIQRYQCKCCYRTFNVTVFHIDNKTKIKIPYRGLAESLVTASGIRDIARKYKCSPSTIQNRINRLARKVMSVCSDLLKNFQLQENLAADGLESFVLSQFFPTNINILAGSKSQFIYDFNAFYFHRKGRMTKEQMEKAEKLYATAKFVKKGPSKSFKELLDVFADFIDRSDKKSFILDTDEHRIYHHQFVKHNRMSTVKHRRTNSRELRNTNNKLFPCNYIDRLIRKDQAEHARETIQFPKNMNNSMSRFTIYSFWHNFISPHRVNKSKTLYKTHAQAAGMDPKVVNLTEKLVFDSGGCHFFKVKENLTPFQKQIWEETLMNPLNICTV